MQNFQIRRATIEDTNEIASIRALAGWAAYTQIDLEQRLPRESPFWVPDYYREILSTLDHNLYVAERSSGIIGFLEFYLETGDNGETVGDINGIYVHPHAQRQGAGTALIDLACDAFRSAGCQAAYLWVRQKNIKAQAFYEHHGWKPDGRKNTVRNAVELTGDTAFRWHIAFSNKA